MRSARDHGHGATAFGQAFSEIGQQLPGGRSFRPVEPVNEQDGQRGRGLRTEVDYGPRTTGDGPRVTDNRLRTTDHGPLTAKNGKKKKRQKEETGGGMVWAVPSSKMAESAKSGSTPRLGHGLTMCPANRDELPQEGAEIVRPAGGGFPRAYRRLFGGDGPRDLVRFGGHLAWAHANLIEVPKFSSADSADLADNGRWIFK